MKGERGRDTERERVCVCVGVRACVHIGDAPPTPPGGQHFFLLVNGVCVCMKRELTIITVIMNNIPSYSRAFG